MEHRGRQAQKRKGQGAFSLGAPVESGMLGICVDEKDLLTLSRSSKSCGNVHSERRLTDAAFLIQN